MLPEQERAVNAVAAFRPLAIGQRLSVLPPGGKVPNGRTPLWMARGAFGSGEHETTRNCLEIIERLNLKATDRVLDLGSGTGILSIAALLLGAGQAWCVDIEQGAIDSCRHNSALNQVNSQITHHCGPLETLHERNFDLGLANIYGDILLQVADDLAARIRPGGILLLSGILWEYNFDVRKCYQKRGYDLIENRMHSEFSTLLLQRTES